MSPPLKSLLKGPPPSFQGIPPIWSAGLFQKASSPTVTCVQTSSHRLERPTILQYSDFRRELLESTEEGSCSSLQKKGKLLTASQAKTWCQRNKVGLRQPSGSQIHVSGNLEWDNKLLWRTEHHKCHKNSWTHHKKSRFVNSPGAEPHVS